MPLTLVPLSPGPQIRDKVGVVLVPGPLLWAPSIWEALSRYPGDLDLSVKAFELGGHAPRSGDSIITEIVSSFHLSEFLS